MHAAELPGLEQQSIEKIGSLSWKTIYASIRRFILKIYSAFMKSPDLAIEKQQRIKPIDNTRGMLIIWMIIAHSLTIAGIDPNDPMRYLRPPGWSTTCFIILSGFTVAVALNNHEKRKRSGSASKLLLRALKIGAIAFGSNLLFKIMSAYSSKNISTEYLVRVLTFKEPWSISAFLVPTMFLLLVSPTIIRVANRMRPWHLLTAAVVIGLCFDEWVGMGNSGSLVQQDLLGALNQGFTWIGVLYFFLYGLWGFAFGNMLKRMQHQKSTWPVIVFSAVLVLLITRFQGNIQGITGHFLLPPARFVVTLAIVLTISRFGTFLGIERFINTLGQSALLIFILHRPFLQIGRYLLHGFLPERALALELISVSLLFSFWIAMMRIKHRNFSTLLSTIGF
jgi:hypothetical protein